MKKADDLSEVLSEFARTLVTDFPVQEILDHVVMRIVDLLPIDAAGVSLISPTLQPLLVAGSDESATRFEHLQGELEEGPCLAAYETRAPISIPDLARDHRFPTYAAAALDEGLAAVFTFPLQTGDRCLGALDLYRESTGDLSETDMATAETLADVTTAYLLNAEGRTARSDFVTTVSHELRTPLTSIAASAEMLQDRVAGPFTHREEMLVDSIVRNSDRLITLTNNLLTVFRMEGQAPDPEQLPLDLREVVLTVQRALEPSTAGRAMEVSFTVPPGPVVVRGNRADLESVVSNLVGNALKFTHDGGRLHCALVTVVAHAYLHVSDSGIGIPHDEQRELFTRFFRASSARDHAVPGSGLGLSIVDAIVQSHGGDISVVSEHLNGSTFTVRLPLVATHPRGDHAPRPESVEGRHDGSVGHAGTSGAAPRP